MLTVAEDEVHLWQCAVGDAVASAGWGSLPELLSPEERAAAARFHFERDRDLYLTAHALLRRALSSHLGVPPEELAFARDGNGKPHLAPARALEFNLAHTHGLALCAVSRSPVGVDAELLEPRRATLEVATRYFAPAEAQALLSLPEPERPARFFELWCLKEAFLKARGDGLSLALDRFQFEFGARGRIDVRFDPSLRESEQAWRFAAFRPTGEHRAALGVRSLPGRPVRVRHWQLVPTLAPAPLSLAHDWSFGEVAPAGG